MILFQLYVYLIFRCGVTSTIISDPEGSNFKLSFGFVGKDIPQVIGGVVHQFKFVPLKIGRIVPFWTIAFFTAAALITGAAFAADKPEAERSDEKPDNTPIIITAEQLESDNKAKFAEFIGNVKATQADFVITSDKLRIYYRGELLNTEKKGNDEEVLKKIVATGNVKITTDQYTNSIIGSKIILYQKDGRVQVLGSKEKRIKAEFFSKGETSETFKLGKPKK